MVGQARGGGKDAEEKIKKTPMAAGRMHDVRCDRILSVGQHTGQPAGQDDPGESRNRTLGHGAVVDYIPVYPMRGAQIYPDPETAAGKEKECIGTAIPYMHSRK